MTIGLYNVVDPDGFEVLIPLSDWLKKRAVEKNDSASQQTIAQVFNLFAGRKYPDESFNYVGIKGFTFDRKGRCKLRKQFSGIIPVFQRKRAS